MLPMGTKLTTGLPSTTATSRWMNIVLSMTTTSNGNRCCDVPDVFEEIGDVTCEDPFAVEPDGHRSLELGALRVELVEVVPGVLNRAIERVVRDAQVVQFAGERAARIPADVVALVLQTDADAVMGLKCPGMAWLANRTFMPRLHRCSEVASLI